MSPIDFYDDSFVGLDDYAIRRVVFFSPLSPGKVNVLESGPGDKMRFSDESWGAGNGGNKKGFSLNSRDLLVVNRVTPGALVLPPFEKDGDSHEEVVFGHGIAPVRRLKQLHMNFQHAPLGELDPNPDRGYTHILSGTNPHGSVGTVKSSVTGDREINRKINMLSVIAAFTIYTTAELDLKYRA